MPTRFLLNYAARLIDALLDAGLVEIAPGRADAVVAYLAAELHEHARGGSLITCTSRALLACPDVVELYADDDELKRVVDELGHRAVLRSP
jgi:hypothetical protein